MHFVMTEESTNSWEVTVYEDIWSPTNVNDAVCVGEYSMCREYLLNNMRQGDTMQEGYSSRFSDVYTYEQYKRENYEIKLFDKRINQSSSRRCI